MGKDFMENAYILNMATDAYFAGKITMEEFSCYQEAYALNREDLIRSYILDKRESYIQSKPWWKRWLYRWNILV